MRRLLHLIPILLLLTYAVPAYQSSATDDRIHDEVIRRLASDRDVKGNTFEVEVKDGIVTVKGEVEKERNKSKAEKLIKKVKGVNGVVNNLTVKKY